jgi:hypothetical protein
MEFDQTLAERIGDLWVGLSDGTPSPIVYADNHRASVLCNYADQLPPDVRGVVVRDRGEEHDVPVENGYFLYAAWKQDTPGDYTDPPEPELVRTISG